jgi:ribose 5-phosphate isomerase B
MEIAFGIDEETEVSKELRNYLKDTGHELPVQVINKPWPEVGFRVGKAVAEDVAHIGIAICYTGTGVTIAANKVPGVRAALCKDSDTAKGARLWNDANVLTLASQGLTIVNAKEILEMFLLTSVDPSEIENIKMLSIYDKSL